jgi:hypothetical protein
MTNREQMAAGLMIAMGMVVIWWVTAPSPPEAPATQIPQAQERQADEPTE